MPWILVNHWPRRVQSALEKCISHYYRREHSAGSCEMCMCMCVYWLCLFLPYERVIQLWYWFGLLFAPSAFYCRIHKQSVREGEGDSPIAHTHTHYRRINLFRFWFIRGFAQWMADANFMQCHLSLCRCQCVCQIHHTLACTHVFLSRF